MNAKRLITSAIVVLLALCLGAAIDGQEDTHAKSATPAAPNETPFDCSRISELGLDRQLNIRAAMIVVGCRGEKWPGQSGPVDPKNPFKPLLPGNYGGVDRNVILPEAPYPDVTQSESMVWGHGDTIVVNYNDVRGISTSCFAGISYSTDGGAAWTRPGGDGASPLCSGHGDNLGDPVVAWNNALGTW